MMSQKKKKKTCEFVKTHRTHVKCRCGKKRKRRGGREAKSRKKRTRKGEMRCEGGVTGSRKRKKRKKKKEEPHTLWLGGLVPVSFLFFLLLFCSLRDNGVARRTYSPLQADGFAAFARLPAMTKYRNRADDLRALIHY